VITCPKRSNKPVPAWTLFLLIALRFRTTSIGGRVAAMLSGSGDCIAFTSSSTVRNLAQLFDTQDLSEALAGVVIACIGDITATTAADYGLQ